MKTITNQNLSTSVNTAFTMSLSAGALSELIQSQDTLDLKFFEDVITQLNWISSQQKKIFKNVLDYFEDGEKSEYLMVLDSMSEEIGTQVDAFTQFLTRSMLVGKKEKTILEGRSYTLHNTVQKYYEILNIVNEKL